MDQMSCKCSDGFFGFDCSQQAVLDTVNSVPPKRVVAGASADLRSPTGLGVLLPAGALATNATLEVQIYNLDLKISDEQPGESLAPAGSIGVFLPHGIQFAQPVKITLKYDQSKVSAGDDVFVYYFNEDATPAVWEKMPSVVVGDTGLIECNTTHFSLFGPMAVAGSLTPPAPTSAATPGSPIASQALQSTPFPEDSPSDIVNNAGDSGSNDQDAQAPSDTNLFIILATTGGVLGAVLVVVGVYFMTRPRNGNKNRGEVEATIGFDPSLQQQTSGEENTAVDVLPAQNTAEGMAEEGFIISLSHELSMGPRPALVSVPAEAETAVFSTLGRTWKDIGPSRPQNGQEIRNKQLQDALRSMIAADLELEFTRIQLDGFGELDLSPDCYVRVDANYYRAMGRPGSDKSAASSGCGGDDSGHVPDAPFPAHNASTKTRAPPPPTRPSHLARTAELEAKEISPSSEASTSAVTAEAMPQVSPFRWLSHADWQSMEPDSSSMTAGPDLAVVSSPLPSKEIDDSADSDGKEYNW